MSCFGDGVVWSWKLFLQNGDVYHETTSYVLSGGMEIILYFNNFNYRHDTFDLFRDNEICLVLGMELTIVCTKVISSVRQRAISRQGVWGVFYMLRQWGGKGIILNFKNFNYMHDIFGLFWDNELYLVLGMKLYGVENCLCKMVMSTSRQRAMSRQGVWRLFCILRTSITGKIWLICLRQWAMSPFAKWWCLPRDNEQCLVRG